MGDGLKTVVVFEMWGQRCETIFDENSELDPLKWLDTTEEKGWLLPIEVKLGDGTVLHNEKELKAILYR